MLPGVGVPPRPRHRAGPSEVRVDDAAQLASLMAAKAALDTGGALDKEWSEASGRGYGYCKCAQRRLLVCVEASMLCVRCRAACCMLHHMLATLRALPTLLQLLARAAQMEVCHMRLSRQGEAPGSCCCVLL